MLDYGNSPKIIMCCKISTQFQSPCRSWNPCSVVKTNEFLKAPCWLGPFLMRQPVYAYSYCCFWRGFGLVLFGQKTTLFLRNSFAFDFPCLHYCERQYKACTHVFFFTVDFITCNIQDVSTYDFTFTEPLNKKWYVDYSRRGVFCLLIFVIFCYFCVRPTWLVYITFCIWFGPWSVVAERSSLPDSSSGVSSRMWVRIPAVTLVRAELVD